MKANQATYPVRRMCGLLGVSPAGYYAWLGRSPSKREQADRALRERIVNIRNGAPRIHAELASDGVPGPCPDQPERDPLVGAYTVRGASRKTTGSVVGMYAQRVKE